MSAAIAAHLRIGRDSASRGDSASTARTRKNAVPAISIMCRPEMERMWARPEMRRLSLVSAESALRSPTSSAAATAPASPGSRRHDARDHRGADARDGEVGSKQRRRLRPSCQRAEHEAACADPFEEGGAARVVAAGHDRARHRHQPRAQRDPSRRAAAGRSFGASVTRMRARQSLRRESVRAQMRRARCAGAARCGSRASTTRPLRSATTGCSICGRSSLSTRSFAAVAPARQTATTAAIRHVAPRR